MDSVTDKDIDRIFKRWERKVDLKTITTQAELFDFAERDVEESMIERGSQRGGRWNKGLNQVMWDELEERREQRLQELRLETKLQRKTTTLGTIADKVVQIIFRKDNTTQIVARDKKGRFTKLDRGELLNVLPETLIR